LVESRKGRSPFLFFEKIKTLKKVKKLLTIYFFNGILKTVKEEQTKRRTKI